MRRVLLGLILGVLIAAPLGYGASRLVSNPMSSDLDGGGHAITNVTDVHATGTLTGDAGLSTTLGGVGTNYVNLNNAAGGVRWQFAQILYGDSDPTVTGRAAPAPSLLLEQTPSGGAALWFKSGAADTAWTLVSGSP